jgi:hypothetical protein
MAASSFLDVCRFNPSAGGTADWTYSSAVTGYQSPAGAGVVNGAQYSYRAESADLSQWEVGRGTYNTGTGVLARTTVLFNSSGTTSKINFSAAPQVAIVALAEDMVPQTVGQLPGVATNTAASAGNVGEVVSSTGTSAALTTATATQIASITLAAGDWDICAEVEYNTGGATSVTDWYSSISLTSATIGAPIANSLSLHERVPASSDHATSQSHIPTQVLISASTTYYFNVRADFTGTAPTASYILRARRMR